MYHLTSGCSTLLYLLARHPILVVALGLVGAVAYLQNPSGIIVPPPVPSIELVAQEMAGGNPDLAERTTYASVVYGGVVAVESGLTVSAAQISEAELYFKGIVEANGHDVRGVHRDGKSYGPAGLTRIAVRELLRKIPDCTILGVQQALLTPEENLKLGYLYFLDLVHRFTDVEVAVVGYNQGPTRVAWLLRHKKPLPRGYLEKVKAHISR